MITHNLETVHFSIDELTPHPRNARQGNIALIKASLERNGQYRAVVVNRGTLTGRPFEILAGHHVVAAATELGWSTVAGHLVNVDEEAGLRILLADNRLSDIAGYDERGLAEILSDMPDFDGTGYDPGDVELILKRINADMDEFPDFDGSNDVDDKDDAGKEVACPKCGHVWTP